MRLREPLTVDDIDWITEACQDAEIRRWTLVPSPYTRDDAAYFVAHPEIERATWVIENELGPVGLVSIHQVNGEGVAEVGYWMAPWGRGAGHASAALEEVVRIATGDPELVALTARIAEANAASRRTAERAGFVESGRIEGGCHDADTAADAIVYRRDLR